MGDKGTMNCHEDVAVELTGVEDSTGLNDGTVDEGVVELDRAARAVKNKLSVQGS